MTSLKFPAALMTAHVTIDITANTITRKGSTFPLSKFLRRMAEEYGTDLVAEVMSSQDQYPPMMDARDRDDVETECSRKHIARAALAQPALMAGLEPLGYSRAEANANK